LVYLGNDLVFPAQEDIGGTYSGKIIPLTSFQDKKLTVKAGKFKGQSSYDSQDDESVFIQPVKSCNPFNAGLAKKQIVEKKAGKGIRFTSVGSSNCLDIDLGNFYQKSGYIVNLHNQNITGKPLFFSIISKTSQKPILETYLGNSKLLETSYFIIPPMEEFGQGYTLHFDNISIGREKVINDLGRIQVYPIPYDFLKNLKITTGMPEENAAKGDLKADLAVKHPNPSWYKVIIGQWANDSMIQLNDATIVLSQSYHPGWVAWVGKPFTGKRLKHVLVNNWENGWQLENCSIDQLNNCTIYLFFWPQMLEYLGFAFLVGLVGFLGYRFFHTFPQ